MIVCDQSVSKVQYLKQQQQEESEEEEEEEKEEKKEEEEEAEEEEKKEEEEDEEEEEKEEEKKKEEKKEEKEDNHMEVEEEKKERPSVIGDADEGKTLFVRNIPMDATQRDLFRFFKRFGKLVYVKLCVDKSMPTLALIHRLTTLSKGTGFVKFENQQDAEALLAKYEAIAAAFQKVGVTSVCEG